MNLQSILKKSNATFLSVTNKKGELIDFTTEEGFTFQKEITLGSDFFLKAGEDFLTNVLKGAQINNISLKSENSHVLFLKNKNDLIFSFYSKTEINTNILKIIVDKFNDLSSS